MIINKIIALAIFLKLPFFQHNQVYYYGKTQKEYTLLKKEILKKLKNSEILFCEWLDFEFLLLEEEILHITSNIFTYNSKVFLVYTKIKEIPIELKDFYFNTTIIFKKSKYFIYQIN